MALQEEVRIRFVADTAAFGAGINNASKKLSRFGTRSFFLGSRITAGIGLPIALLTKAIVGMGAAFDQAMTESLAIMGEDGNRLRTQMEDTAKSIALQTKFSATEAAQAYFFLASSGLTAAESMAALPVAAQFAQAGIIKLEKATELLSDAYITLGLRSSDPIENMENMQRVADVLTEANNRAQGSIIEFSQALTNRAGVAFRVFGISVEQGVAALAAFAERGIKGRTAGRQLFIVIRDLQRAFIKNTKEWDTLVGPGAVFDRTTGEFKDLSVIIGTLENSLEGLSDITKKQKLQLLGFQERSLQATLALVGASHRIKEFSGWMEKAGGATQRVSEKQMTSFTNQLGLVSERLKQVAIDLFDAFRPTIENHVLPMVRSFIKKIQDLTSWISTLSRRSKILIVNFLGFGVALGPVIAAIGALSLILIPVVSTFRILSVVVTVLKGFIAVLGTQFLLLAQRTFAAGAAIELIGTQMAFLGSVTTKLSAIFLRYGKIIGVIVQVAAALGAAFVAWKWVGSKADESASEMKNLSDQIGITHHRFVELIAAYKDLSANTDRTEDQNERLAHTINMLAAATGTTTGLFQEQAQDAKKLAESLDAIAAATKSVGAGQIELLRSRRAMAQASFDEAQAEKKRLEDLIKGASMDPSSGRSDARSRPAENRKAENLKASIEAFNEWTRVAGEAALANSNLSKEILALAAATGNLSDAEMARHEANEAQVDSEKNQIEIEKQRVLANAAYTESVHDIADSLTGLADDDMMKLVDAWELVTEAGHVDAEAVKLLWARYEGMREGIQDLPPALEEATQAFIKQAEAIAFNESTIGKFLLSMEGFDPIADELIADQDLIIKKFNELDKAMDPRFFEENGTMLETLADHYSSTLAPGIKEIIDLYLEWKIASEQTSDSVVADVLRASNSVTEVTDRMRASMMDKQSELAVFSLNAQDAEIYGLKKGYNSMVLSHTKAIATMESNINLLTGVRQTAAREELAQYRSDSAIMLAAEKRIGSLRMLARLDVDQEILRNHKKLTQKQLDNLIEFQLENLKEYEDYYRRIEAIRSASALFSELSQVSPQLAGVANVLGDLSSSTNSWLVNIQSFKDETATSWDKVTASIGAATDAVAAYNAISQIESREGKVASGAYAGAQMGSVFGRIGTVVGGIVGGVAGLFSKDPGWMDVRKTINLKWGLNVSDELAKSIEETSKKIGSDLGGMLFHISEVIESSGGLSVSNIGFWVRNVRDAFSLIDQGIYTTAEAARALDASFGDLSDAGIGLGGIIRQDVFELMLLDDAFGTNSEAIDKFKDAMKDKALAGLDLFTEGVTATRTKFEKEFDAKISKVRELGIATEEELLAMQDNFHGLLTKGITPDFENLETAVEQAFSLMVAEGKTLGQILGALGKPLDELGLLMTNLGLKSGMTVGVLLRFREFYKVNDDLIKKIEGSRLMMEGLANSGWLTKQSFESFGKIAGQQLKDLTTRGLESDEALLLMVPSLQKILKASELYGFDIDANTQSIIDQAKEKGLLGEKSISADEKMLLATEGIGDAVRALVLLFQTALPDAVAALGITTKSTASDMAKDIGEAAVKVQDSLDSIEFKHLSSRLTIEYNDATGDYWWGVDDPMDTSTYTGQAQSYAKGGLITRPTLAMTGEGGESELIGPVGFMSKALEGAMKQAGPSDTEREMLLELHGLRGDLQILPIHLRDAIILAG